MTISFAVRGILPLPRLDLSTLLIHADGTDGSTSFIDSSLNNYTITANGNAQISTAQSVFGTGSAVFDGITDWLSTTGANLVVGVGDFTIDCWIRPRSFTTAPTIAHSPEPDLTGWEVFSDTGGVLSLFTNTALRITHQTPLTLNVQTHVALTRAAGVHRLFGNGIKANTDYTDNKNYTTNGLQIGAGTTGVRGFDGWIDEIRFIKGYAAWTSNFTPPTAAYSS